MAIQGNSGRKNRTFLLFGPCYTKRNRRQHYLKIDSQERLDFLGADQYFDPLLQIKRVTVATDPLQKISFVGTGHLSPHPPQKLFSNLF